MKNQMLSRACLRFFCEPKEFDMETLLNAIPYNVIDMQKTALLGIARILRKMLEM